MDLEELRAFLAVVEAGSFLAAADALGVSRTTLRRRVDALEARAGVSLVESGPQGVQVTEAGALLAERGHQMVLEGRALLASIRDVGREPEGLLRVGLPVGLPPHVFTMLYATIREVFPGLRLLATFGVEPQNEALMDLDFIAHFSDDPPKGPWISYIIARPRRWLIASPDYLARRGTPKTPSDLLTHELFSWPAPGEDGREWPLVSGGTIRVEPALITPDIHLIRSCCLAGLGIGFVPDALLPDPGHDDSPLVPVLPALIGQAATLRVSVPRPLAGLPKIKAILSKISALVDDLE